MAYHVIMSHPHQPATWSVTSMERMSDTEWRFNLISPDGYDWVANWQAGYGWSLRDCGGIVGALPMESDAMSAIIEYLLIWPE